MSIILGIETSTEACSVALSAAGRVYTEYVLEPQAHSKLLLGMVAAVCEQAALSLEQIQAFAFGQGPGSFTGLRIAASVIQGLAYGLDKPVVAVSSLQVLALQGYKISNTPNVLPILDARMHQIYCAAYRFKSDLLSVCEITDCLLSPQDLNLEPFKNYLLLGTGALAYESILLKTQPNLQISRDILYPRAEELVQLAAIKLNQGQSIPASSAVPVYIRNNVVQTSKKNPD